MLRYINPIRLHGGDGFGVYAMGFNAGTIYFGPVAGKML
jgi:allophanate hydrolase subunit 1